VGGKSVLSDVEADLYPKCHPEIQNPELVSEVPIACLTRVYFQKESFSRIYGEVAPELVKQLESWDLEGMDSFRKSMLNSILPGWTENGSFPRSQLESLVSVPHYTENLFQRFDSNRDNILVFSEIMKGFPIFCREIKKAAGSLVSGSCEPGESPGRIEAIFGYLIFHGVPPRGVRPGDSLWQKILAIKEIYSWYRTWRKLDRNPAVRDVNPPQIDRKDILKIMSNLATQG
jgi:hypothetical protein